MKENVKKGLGKEVIHAKEADYTAIVIERLKAELAKNYPEGKTLRQFHAKMHGCVDAEFIIDSDLPEHLKVGIFSQAKTYVCKIRFSNGSPGIKKDKKKAVRGMAIQLLDENHASFQDFILTTAKTLSPGKVKAYKSSIVALTGTVLHKAGYTLNPFNWGDIIRLLKTMQQCPNLLGVDYYSGAPFLFGEGNAVKYNVRPTASKLSPMPSVPGDDYLRELLVKDLSTSEVRFDFSVQLQEDPILQPIEDTRKEWKTPFHKVATIRIRPQEFDTTERRAKAESMIFSPWNSLLAHRPLGGINRARKQVYEELAKFRLERSAE